MSSVARVCDVDGCGRPHLARGFCTGHYQRFSKGLDVSGPLQGRNLKTCIVSGCTNSTKARNRCNLHYEEIRAASSECCILRGCESPGSLRGLCSRHYPLTRKYNVTPEWLKTQWERGCAICGEREGVFHVDHDHACCSNGDSGFRSCGGCVRGVLCGSCNWGLGKFRDREDLLVKAARYLSETRFRP